MRNTAVDLLFSQTEQAYERYAGEWKSILSAGFESFLGIGYFWKAISGKDPITGDILSEAEQKSAAWCGTTELAVSLISAACAASGVGSFFLLLGAEGLSGSMAAMTYESAVLSGMSETEAAILALLTGMTSGCALDDIISNSDTTMTKLGNQLGKSSDEMKDVMGGLKRLAADNNFSSVDDMLDAALNNPSRLPAGLHDDIIEAIDGPMGGFNLPKNVDVDVPSVAGKIEGGTNTVWDNITPTQDNYPYTTIPRSFEIEVNGQKMWVHGNATEHIYEDVYKAITTGKGTAYTNPNLYTQEIISDFHGALQEATKSGIVYGEVIAQGNWEFIFAKPRQVGQLPVIKHAQFNGWH